VALHARTSGSACNSREFGVLLTARASVTGSYPSAVGAADPNVFSGVPPSEGGPAQVVPNPSYSTEGYAFALDLSEGTSAAVTLQLYDPAPCEGPDSQRTTFELLAPDPGGGGTTVVRSDTYASTQCDGQIPDYQNTWVTFSRSGLFPTATSFG